jgi:hypothetical protein
MLFYYIYVKCLNRHQTVLKEIQGKKNDWISCQFITYKQIWWQELIPMLHLVPECLTHQICYYFLPHVCDTGSDDPRAGKWFSSVWLPTWWWRSAADKTCWHVAHTSRSFADHFPVSAWTDHSSCITRNLCLAVEGIHNEQGMFKFDLVFILLRIIDLPQFINMLCVLPVWCRLHGTIATHSVRNKMVSVHVSNSVEHITVKFLYRKAWKNLKFIRASNTVWEILPLSLPCVNTAIVANTQKTKNTKQDQQLSFLW